MPAGSAELVADVIQLGGDCDALALGDGELGLLEEVVAARLEPTDGIAVDFESVNLCQSALLALVGLHCECLQLLQHPPHVRRLVCRPVSERLLLGDQGGDLFEFDEVWPVSDDPFAALALCGHRAAEVLVHLLSVEL